MYTLLPNQATGTEKQAKINAKREQTLPRRLAPDLIKKKPLTALQL